jgi:cellulose biosynthesis protein BcsE
MAIIPPALSATFKRTAALRRNLERGTASLMRRRPVLKLAIEGLPDQFATLQPQGLHAVYVASSAARDALLFDTVRNAKAKFITLLLARQADEVAESLRERGFGVRQPAQAAVPWPRKFNVLTIKPPPAAAEFEAATVAPLARLVSGLRALKRFGSKVDALYIVEGADHWFSWHNPAALAQEARFLANWCAMRRCSMVLILAAQREHDEQLDVPIDERPNLDSENHSLHGFHGAFTGVAHLLQSHGEMIWKVEFWRVNDAMVTGESLPLRFTGDGSLSIAPMTTETSLGAMLLTRDEHRVVVSLASVAGEHWVPTHWEVAASNPAVVEACRGARGVTVLLDYANQRELADLCQTVHALRGHCGRALKIVVRERGEFMRHQYELLVLSLGANLVIGRDVPFSRVQSLLESVQGQLSTKPIVADYQTVLSAALSDSVCGYLTVPLFCEQVERVIERGRVLRLPHMLLQLQLRPEIAHLEALRKCTLRRAGDVCTADHDYLYLFLFACRVSDADTVLQRTFGADLAFFFEDEVRYIDDIDFVEQLTKLKSSELLRAAPDYRDALAVQHIGTPAQELQRVAPTSETALAAMLAPVRTVPDAGAETASGAPTQSVLRSRKDKWPHAQAHAMPIVKSGES